MIALAAVICACLPIYILINYGPVNNLRPCMVTTDIGYIVGAVTTYMFLFTIPTLSMGILSWLTMNYFAKETINRHKSDMKSLVIICVTGKDAQLIGMLTAQVVLYFITNMPFISLVLYGAFTVNVSQSVYEIAVVNFANALFTNLFSYCYNAWPFLFIRSLHQVFAASYLQYSHHHACYAKRCQTQNSQIEIMLYVLHQWPTETNGN
ncbi:unnamed protein product [Adineta ricciae]|uniref:G-protein coupled receptors family 1 profile domain-containing protein n=1 Tax=Adineta ricciae TaxID=249248 RepID=A0A816FBD0_ADIRI|nr:unnamed protein product [Adineta ricciae]